MDPSYSEYVRHLSREQTSLRPLAEFLKRFHKQPEIECHTACLEFYRDGTTCYSQLDVKDSVDRTLGFAKSSGVSDTVGLCLLIEDIGPWVIEELGKALDIDPYFFCGHIERHFVDIEKNPPSALMTSLPSRVGSRNFASFPYQRPIDLGELDPRVGIPFNLRLRGDLTEPRQALPELFGRSVGFIRSCFSILYRRVRYDRWICIMLMDSTSADVLGCLKIGKEVRRNSFRARQVPYRNRRGSMAGMPTYSKFCKAPKPRDVRFIPLMEEVARSIQNCARASISPPSMYNMSFLSTGPIRLMIDEWLTYSLIMSRYVKSYEYLTKSVQDRITRFESEDIIDLYRWRRRGQHSLRKLQILKWFVESSPSRAKHDGHAPLFEEGEALMRDIEHVMNQIEHNGRALEAMVPIMTSIIQLLDSRRSTAEATNVKRLTYIALVFLPLSFVATLFSMSDTFSLAGNGFWIYVVIAVPLLLLVLAASSLRAQATLGKLRSLLEVRARSAS